MDISRVVILAFSMLALVLIVAIIFLTRTVPTASPAAAAAMYAALGVVISGLIAFVHRLPLPAENPPK